MAQTQTIPIEFNSRFAKQMLTFNPSMPTVPTFAIRETDVSRHNGGTSGAPLKAPETIVFWEHYRLYRTIGQQMLERRAKIGCKNATVGKNGLTRDNKFNEVAAATNVHGTSGAGSLELWAINGCRVYVTANLWNQLFPGIPKINV